MGRVSRMSRVNGRGYLAVIGVLGAQRIAEASWSARNIRRSGPAPTASPETFPAMVLANAALFVVPAITRYGRRRPHPGVRAGAAVALRLWVIRTLGAQWNVRAAVPADMEPVTGGPYRWVRHPNYVAVAVEFAALPVLGGGYAEALALSVANAAVLRSRIRAEERLLDAIPAYRRAFAGVPRFLPRRPAPCAQTRPSDQP